LFLTAKAGLPVPPAADREGPWLFLLPGYTELRASLNGANGTVGNVDVKVDNAESPFKSAVPAEAPNLAGPSQGGEL